jgi:hypothetical protein
MRPTISINVFEVARIVKRRLNCALNNNNHFKKYSIPYFEAFGCLRHIVSIFIYVERCVYVFVVDVLNHRGQSVCARKKKTTTTTTTTIKQTKVTQQTLPG